MANAQIFRERPGVAQTACARITCGHGNAEHLVRAERLRCEHGHECGVNAAGQADHHRFKTAFVNVIANAERQRGKQLLLARREIRVTGACGLWAVDFRLQIRHKNFLGKSFSERGDFAARIQHDAVAVKNQLVVRADEIDLRQRHALVARHALEHRQPRAFLAVMPRRRGKVKDDFRALPDEFLDRVTAIKPFRPEILVVPDVLADGDAEFAAIERKRGDAFGRFKIAVFVKNVVSREQAFVRAPDNFPVLQNGGGIAERASGTLGIFTNTTDAQWNGADAFGGFRECRKIGLNKIGAQEQIARRVATEKQFRCDDEFRAERAGFFITGDEFLPVRGKVADGRVELEQADFQGN